MKWYWVIFLPTLACAQEFQFHQEWDSIEVRVDNYQIAVPWTGGYSFTVPAFSDIDGDSYPDIFLGNSSGHLAYYRNTGNAFIPDFELITPEFQGIQGFAHSVPYFADIDADSDYDLFCDFGNSPMRFYRNIGTTTTPQFILEEDSLRDTSGNLIDGSGFSICDINADGTLDLFVQQWNSGNIYYYENVGAPNQFSFSLITTNFANVNTGYWSHPKFCDIDNDSDYDLFIGDRYGHIWFYRNDGTPQQYNFILVSNNWLGIDVGDYASPEFCDIDGDGDYDLFIGRDAYTFLSSPGDIFFYQNIGTSQFPQFQLVTTNTLTLDVGTICIPCLADIDADGDLDLFYSSQNRLGFYRNDGTSSEPHFTFVTNDLLNGQTPHFFDLFDLNADGKLDLICAIGSIGSGKIKFYLNQGTLQNPNFVYWFSLFTPYILGMVSLADLDRDGDGDLIVSTFQHGTAFYRNQGTARQPNFVFEGENWGNIPPGEKCPLCGYGRGRRFRSDRRIQQSWIGGILRKHRRFSKSGICIG